MLQHLITWLSTFGNLLLVVFGFSFIIFIHELGHFVAARWAGIRVLAFALGFGPAAVSYRKGLGVRPGSSEAEYQRLLEAQAAGVTTTEGARATHHSVSPTEYRLNWLPFGGYVKMLGQDDANPMATSDAPDSYQNTPPWKRMIVISAGVVMNVITAAVLFIGVFMHGLPTEPPVIGEVAPGSPASLAGLRPGDQVTEVNAHRPTSFNDLSLSTAMAGRGGSVDLKVERAGAPEPLSFNIRPRTGTQSKLLEIGVGPLLSNVVYDVQEKDRKIALERFAKFGLGSVRPGMRLVAAGDHRDVKSAHDLTAAVARSGGRPVTLVFGPDPKAKPGSEPATAAPVTVTIEPEPEMERGTVGGTKPGETDAMPALDHLAGLTPLMMVQSVAAETAEKLDLREGDIFRKIGAKEFPRVDEGIAEIRSRKNGTIPLVVLRKDTGGQWIERPLEAKVDGKGHIGFGFAQAEQTTLVALPPELLIPIGQTEPAATAAAGVITRPGSRIVSVNGEPVATFGDIRAALARAAGTEGAGVGSAGEQAVRVKLAVELPLGADGTGGRVVENRELLLGARDAAAIRALGWKPKFELSDFFRPEEIILKADTPGRAVRMGLAETKRVMLTTYLTFARLFDGTVKVEHLKGPVGIAHLGTQIAERGFTQLFFFMALISVNLAVINFLPLPIVDGGQFILLLVEQVRGRPVPLGIQNAATIAGLILIGTIFLVTTFNDIRHLFQG
jgi:regulator of sigma E protease